MGKRQVTVCRRRSKAQDRTAESVAESVAAEATATESAMATAKPAVTTTAEAATTAAVTAARVAAARTRVAATTTRVATATGIAAATWTVRTESGPAEDPRQRNRHRDRCDDRRRRSDRRRSHRLRSNRCRCRGYGFGSRGDRHGCRSRGRSLGGRFRGLPPGPQQLVPAREPAVPPAPELRAQRARAWAPPPVDPVEAGRRRSDAC